MTDRAEYRQILRQTMADLTADMADDTVDVQWRLQGVTSAAVAAIRGVTLADVMLIDGDGFESVAATSPLMCELDAVQMRGRQGPCLQAAVADAIIRVPDLRTEERWPEFTAAALAAGVHSVLSFQLYTHRHGSGALNLFSSSVGAFNLDDEAIGAMFATHAAIVLIASRDADELTSLRANNDLVGQAKGILMERFVIDAVGAFDLMVAWAERTSATIQSIALDIVTSI